jgi:hypothetical protein
MALATVIRLEFAYPGVGILAGDSIQYLSIATAHGVIMVFFMIMPAIFGAFGNFLLPTQLGVHDVAFPRLNSAAFWFLPGGLLMLCQLVCVDRRYQRMNCFNIRELQGILKRKFFPDLINISDHRNLMETSMIGLRFKYNNADAIRPEQSLFYNFGTTNTSKQKNYSLTSYMYSVSAGDSNNTTGIIGSGIMSNLVTNLDSRSIGISALKTYSLWLNELFNFIVTTSMYSFIASSTSVSYIKSFLNQNLYNYLPVNFIKINSNNEMFSNLQNSQKNDYLFTTGNINSGTFSNFSSTATTETTSMVRFNKHSNALIGYDYKSGHYLGIWDQLYPSLTTSFIEVSRSIRKAP